MDIADLLGSTSSTGLLVLMAIPLAMAVLLVAVLFYFYGGDKKKTKMKLGIQGKTAPSKETAAAPAEPTKATLTASEPVLPNETMSLNLDILSARPRAKVAAVDPPPAETEPVDLAARLGALSSSPPPTPTPNSPVVPIPLEPVELLRLLREPQSGQLVVEIAGQRYTRLADITDKQIGQYVLKLAAHLLAFTNGLVVTEAGVKPFPAPKVGAAPLPPVSPAPVLPPVLPPLPPPVVESSPLSLPPAAPVVILQAQPTAPEKLQAQRRGLFGKSKPDEGPMLAPLNLADQINQIAQAKLALSPLAATTKLEIVSDPAGGIQIRVNGLSYSSPDDVPLPEVKMLIKEAIKQWEKS